MERENPKKKVTELNKYTNRNIKAFAEQVRIFIKRIKWYSKGRDA
jgi:hypothetical protein